MTVLPAPMLGSLIDVLVVILWITLFVSALVLIFVILIQEGKGGGLAAALGGAGTEAFGVKSGGINRFTAIVAAVFLLSAIFLAAIREPTAATTAPKDESEESSVRVEMESCPEA